MIKKLLLNIFIIVFSSQASISQGVVFTNVLEIDMTKDSLELSLKSTIETEKELTGLINYFSKNLNINYEFDSVQHLLRKIGYNFSFPFTNRRSFIPVIIKESNNKKEYWNYLLFELQDNYNEEKIFLVKDSLITQKGNSKTIWLNLFQKKQFNKGDDKGVFGFIGMELFFCKKNSVVINKKEEIDCGQNIKSFHKLNTVLGFIKEEFETNNNKSDCIKQYFKFKWHHNNRGINDGISYKEEEEEGGRIENIFENKYKLEASLLEIIKVKDSILYCNLNNGKRCSEKIKLQLINNLYDKVGKLENLNYDSDGESDEDWFKLYKAPREKIIEKYLNSLNTIIQTDNKLNYNKTIQELYADFIRKTNNTINVNNYLEQKQRIFETYLSSIDTVFDMSLWIPFSNIKNIERFEEMPLATVIKSYLDSRVLQPLPAYEFNVKYNINILENGDISIKIINDTSAKVLSNVTFRPGKYESIIEKQISSYITDLENYLCLNIFNYKEQYKKELTVNASADGVPFREAFTIPDNQYDLVKKIEFFLTNNLNNKPLTYSFEELYSLPIKTKGANFRNNSLLAFMRAFRISKFIIDKVPQNEIISNKINCFFFSARDQSKRYADITYLIKKKTL